MPSRPGYENGEFLIEQYFNSELRGFAYSFGLSNNPLAMLYNDLRLESEFGIERFSLKAFEIGILGVSISRLLVSSFIGRSQKDR